MKLSLEFKYVYLFFLHIVTILTFSNAKIFTLELDGSKKLADIPHFWSECVGTGTMEYYLKPEWQVAAKIGAKEAGFKYVRGHGIFVIPNSIRRIQARVDMFRLPTV